MLEDDTEDCEEKSGQDNSSAGLPEGGCRDWTVYTRLHYRGLKSGPVLADEAL